MIFPENVQILNENSYPYDPENISYIKFGLTQAYLSATLSQDPNTWIGAAVSPYWGSYNFCLGTNKFPDKVESTDERWQRPLKYSFVTHAEENACYQASKFNFFHTKSPRYYWISDTPIMFCTCYACPECAKTMIQMGIGAAIGHLPAYNMNNPRWEEGLMIAFEMFKEAGISCYIYDGILENAPKIRINDQEFDPSV